MTVRAVEVTGRSVFANGLHFGDVGPYELLRSRMTVALDRSSAANQAIADLVRARRSSSGDVEIESDVLRLRPRDTTRGNGCLLNVIPNRGTTGGLPFSYDEPPRFGPETGLHPADGWLLRSGWTVIWTGWQWDIPRTNGKLGCSVPEVVDQEGRPLEGTVRVELQPFLEPAASLPLRSASDLSGTTTCYPAAELRQADAELSVAHRRGEPFAPVSRSTWRFARTDDGGTPVPDRESLWLEGGFRPDRVYQIRYRTNRCPLVGAGLAAIRDVASHILSTENDLVHGFAVGWSQSGRFLREFLRSGFNCDEGGRRVFDAVLPFVAGAGGGEFNQRYGQPSEAQAEGFSDRAPVLMRDLLAVDRARGTAPKVVSVDTASEYWRGSGSLAHIDRCGQDVASDAVDARAYYLAGTEHLGGAPLASDLSGPQRNFVSVSPINRAVLELTRRWVVDSAVPPPSRLPRRDDGTAIPRHDALRRWSDCTGIVAPKESDMLCPKLDGKAQGSPSPVYVSELDSDGNEVAGIRHPELSAPLATHTGWNLLLTQGVKWTSVGSISGNSHLFSQHALPRWSADQRLSIAERYRDIDDYLAHLQSAAEKLADEGFLLVEDVDRVVADGRGHFEALADPTKH